MYLREVVKSVNNGVVNPTLPLVDGIIGVRNNPIKVTIKLYKKFDCGIYFNNINDIRYINPGDTTTVESTKILIAIKNLKIGSHLK